MQDDWENAVEQRKEKLITDIRRLYRKLPQTQMADTREYQHARFVLESVLAMKTAELRAMGMDWH